MRDWLSRIPHCFSPEDLVFAGTPDEAMHARQLRAELRRSGIAPDRAEMDIQKWLHSECSNTGHIHEQMERVRDFFAAM